MVLFDSRHYRIERFVGTPKPVALDRKEQCDGYVCLVNVGWFHCKEHATTAMARDFLERYHA